MKMSKKIEFESLALQALKSRDAGVSLDDACKSAANRSINAQALMSYICTNYASRARIGAPGG